MEKSKRNVKKILLVVGCAVLLIGLFVSIGFNIYQAYFGWDSYLQSTDEIYIMEAGILKNNLQFHEGTDHELTYDFFARKLRTAEKQI